MSTRTAKKRSAKSDAAAPEPINEDDGSSVRKSAKSAKPKEQNGPSSSTPDPKARAKVVDGDAHSEPTPSATTEKGEGRAPAARGVRGRPRGPTRTPTRLGRSRERTPARSAKHRTPDARSTRHRERTPISDIKRRSQTPPRISFEDEEDATNANSHDEDEQRETAEEDDTVGIPDEHSVSYVDDGDTLLERDFCDAHEGRKADNTEEWEASTQDRENSKESLLQREWRRVPRNFTLPTYSGGKDGVLPFIDGLVHTFETWSIDPRVQVQFAFAQLRDRTARDWMKRNPTGDFPTFSRRFTERFGSHTLRRDALRALRDIRQTGGSNQGFVAAFESVLEELEHHNLTIGEAELLLFLQLAVNERVRDALEWRDFGSVRAALNKIANLTSGQGTYPAPRTQTPQANHGNQSSQRARAPTPAPHQPPRFPQAGIEQFRRRCHGCGSEDHMVAQCPQGNRTQPNGYVPFNNGRGHQGNGYRPRR
jgi:hypothetical protein